MLPVSKFAPMHEVSPHTLAHWTPRPRPQRVTLEGRFVRLEPLDAARHGDDLFVAASTGDAEARFRWLFETPPASRGAFQPWLDRAEASEDPLFFAIIDRATGKAVGRQTLMRIDPANGVIETGNIHWGPAMQRSPLSTEALFLHARHVFDDLGYRRFEWKCNNRNNPSKRAAARFGFSYEGLFRQHMIVKGENRDTAWFAMIDREWPVLRAGYEAWLAPANFDADGRQRLALGDLTALRLAAGDWTLARWLPGRVDEIVAFQHHAYDRTRRHTGLEPMPLMWDYESLLARAECWVLRDGEGLAAVLILSRDGDDMMLDSIATAERIAGQGVGALLMDAALARAKALHVPRLRLITNALNPAGDWYRRIGFALDRDEAREDGRRALHFSITAS